MKDQVLQLVIETVRDVAEDQGVELSAELNDDTRLFGDDGLLDSLTLVSLVVAVEQGIEEKFGARVEVADDKALSQKNSPFRTIGSLAAYAARELEERKPGA